MNALKGAAGRSWRAVPAAKQIARLPRDRRGYPVPAVAGVNADSSPNLSELESMAATRCHRQRRCSTCGEKLARARSGRSSATPTTPASNRRCMKSARTTPCAPVLT